jgi:hypothetical protein
MRTSAQHDTLAFDQGFQKTSSLLRSVFSGGEAFFVSEDGCVLAAEPAGVQAEGATTITAQQAAPRIISIARSRFSDGDKPAVGDVVLAPSVRRTE